MLPHLERHVIEYRHVGEEGAELKQHTHPATHSIKPVVVEFVHHLARHFYTAGQRLELPADQAKQRRLTATTSPHQRDDLATRHGHVDTFEDSALAVTEDEIIDLDEVCVGHRYSCY